jgi:serine/threonine protein kinase
MVKEYYNENDARKIITQLIKAVNFCHDKGIVHRDLKLDNILLSSTDPELAVIKISDFGFSK